MADTSADEAKIRDLIRRNLVGVWTNDLELWSSCFVHEPYLVKWGWWAGGGPFIRIGWDDLRERFRNDMPPLLPEFAHGIKIEDLSLQVRGDTAWAIFNQQYPPHSIPDHVGPGLMHELRVFERVGGEWKIAVVATLDRNAGKGGEVILRLSPDGEILWTSPAAESALADDDDLVVRNGRIRFRDARLNRKLVEAIQWAAGHDTTYASTRGAVPIVADSGEGLAVKVYWVLADAGMLFFVIGGAGMSEERLSHAAVIFGLSPAQAAVAGLVAEGLSLPEIAQKLGITPNTARTHLNRMYEKVGVRTQPALVRVLLSTASPI
jgi:DNA-binding CsgD family transcriptional regulator